MQNIFPQDASEICAIITTFRPQPTIVECVKQLIPQVKEITIVDDGDSEESVLKLRQWFDEIPMVKLCHQSGNYGIAAALNVGIKISQKQGFQWFLLLDDDSIPDSNMVKRLCAYLTRIQSLYPVGIIGMNRREINGGRQSARKNFPKNEWLCKRGIITSGSFFSLQTYALVGPFREEFFIDSVDYDFCMRARSKGLKVVQVQENGFTHSSGQNERIRFGCFTINTISHSPTRLYYAFRNSTILAKEYLWNDPLYSSAVLISQFKTIMRIVLFQTNKAKKLLGIVRGYKDAVKGKMGKIETFGVDSEC